MNKKIIRTMKFTEEEAYNELVSQLKMVEANPLVNERAIRDIIKDDFSLLGESEIEVSDYAVKRVGSLKSVDGCVRNISKTEIENFQKTFKPKVEDAKIDVKPTNGLDDNPILKQMQEQLKAMQEQIMHDNEQKEIAGKTKELKAKMAELGIKDKDWVNDFLSEVTISKDIDVNAKAESYLKIYNKQKAFVDETFTPLSSGGSSKNEDEFLKREAERRKARREREKNL